MSLTIKNLITEDSKIFFTSDTHFGHKNIIKWCRRPFSDITEMDEFIIESWNKVVPKDGIVFHLGDFAFHKLSKWETIKSRLNGTIVLITGNHDLEKCEHDISKLKSIFEFVYPKLEIYIRGRRLWLNHEPLLCFSGERKGAINLFGHVHTPINGFTEMCEDFETVKSCMKPCTYDVGCDFSKNYSPVSFEDVMSRIDIQMNENINYIHKWM